MSAVARRERAALQGAHVEESPSGVLHVTLSDGQEVWLHRTVAAALDAALLADGQTHALWLHGRTR